MALGSRRDSRFALRDGPKLIAYYRMPYVKRVGPAQVAVRLLALGGLAVTLARCGSDAGGSLEGGGVDGGGAGADSGFSFGDGATTDAALDPDAACASSTLTATKAMVDIIFVIDTSGSMTEEIVQTKKNINDFAQTIGKSGLDYQVIMLAQPGVAGNSVCVPPPLGGANCASNPPTFQHIPVGIGSKDSLSKILSTYDSATPNLNWAKYLRPTATKVFVEITDDNSALAFASFETQLLAKLPAGMFGTAQNRKYIFDSICGWTDPSAPLSAMKCPTAVNIGAEYQNLSLLTKGIIDSVCKADYKAVFQNIAKGVSGLLGCQFNMPVSNGNPIDPTKVLVYFTPGSGPSVNFTQVTDPSKCAQFPDGWYFDNNAAPTKILLCAGACATVGSDASGKVDILVGCATQIPK